VVVEKIDVEQDTSGGLPLCHHSVFFVSHADGFGIGYFIIQFGGGLLELGGGGESSKAALGSSVPSPSSADWQQEEVGLACEQVLQSLPAMLAPSMQLTMQPSFSQQLSEFILQKMDEHLAVQRRVCSSGMVNTSGGGSSGGTGPCRHCGFLGSRVTTLKEDVHELKEQVVRLLSNSESGRLSKERYLELLSLSAQSSDVEVSSCASVLLSSAAGGCKYKARKDKQRKKRRDAVSLLVKGSEGHASKLH
jgi:hypothetical protein